MTEYAPPVSDILFLFNQVFGEEIKSLGIDSVVNSSVVEEIAETFGAFANKHLMPLNIIADRQGCQIINGEVIPPNGYAALWKRFCDDNWNGLPIAAEWGGQGLPHVAHFIVREILASTGIPFSLYHELSVGVSRVLIAHGPEWIKRLALPKLVTGQWAGTMNLTEPHCGSDLGLIRTKAYRIDDGCYRISGEKIFITCGDHNLTENILHLVLARIEGAPAGVRGISLFLVPKLQLFPPHEGERGKRNIANGVSVTRIENKMGLHGSPTCAMRYDNSIGWLIGTANNGLSHMFTMMNASRLGVGIQGVGLGELALQAAKRYASCRLQGRTSISNVAKDQSDPIIKHPDVRRELLTMRAWIDSGRAWGWWIALELDALDLHASHTRREKAAATLGLLTPIYKAALSDQGFEVTNRAMMVHGGHGYITDVGIEQMVRDVRIAAIYEGTNGIQARDLVLRKIPHDDGNAVKSLLSDVMEFLSMNVLPNIDQPVLVAAKRLRATTEWVLEIVRTNPDRALGGSYDYLNQFAIVIQGYLWARMARAAHLSGNLHFKDKKETAEFFVKGILPKAEAYAQAAMSNCVPELC